MPGLEVAAISTTYILSARAQSHDCPITAGPEKRVQEDKRNGLGKSWSVSTLQAQIQSFPIQNLKVGLPR